MTLLHPKTAPAFILLALHLVVPVGVISAESTINCHCFKDRTYNPADPWSTDDYILATSFNSFLSRSFGVPKREIVMLKMKEGVSQDDLLIGLEIARTRGIDLQRLFNLRRQGLDWSDIVAELVPVQILEQDRLLATIRAGISLKEASTRIADKRIGNFFGVDETVLQRFRENGLTAKEIPLVLILAHARDQRPSTIIIQSNTDGTSWSAIAAGLGIDPAAAGKLILQYPVKQLIE